MSSHNIRIFFVVTPISLLATPISVALLQALTANQSGSHITPRVSLLDPEPASRSIATEATAGSYGGV